MFRINGRPVRDAAPYLAYYYSKGLPTDLLQKCNSQQFRFIDGIGEGYFIADNVTYTSGDSITLQIFGPTGTSETPIAKTLFVLDVIEIEHPSAAGTKTRIIHTAEDKFALKLVTVPDNYNVIHRRTVELATVAGEILLGSGGSALSLEAVITSATGMSCSNNTGVSIQPYDVFIEGMSAFDAVELLCRANGFLWTMDSESITLWSDRSVTDPSYIKIDDVRRNIVTPPQRRFNIVFPVLDCCVDQPIEFVDEKEAATRAGDGIKTYMPFFPGLLFTDGTLTNESDIIEVRQTLRPEFEAVAKLSNNYVNYPYYKYFDTSAQPRSLRLTYSDHGGGFSTTISGKEYPYVPMPTSPIRDRQCRNWVGKLRDGYNQDDPPIDGFWVIPEFGIDGKIPTDDEGAPKEQYVVNLYKWNYGADNAWIRVEWDCKNYRWIPLQQEYICPTEDTFPEQEDPTPEEYDDIDYLP